MKMNSFNLPAQAKLITEDGAQALAEKLAADIAHQLETSVVLYGKASLAVSGGSTPVAMFKALSSYKLDWEKISVFLVDERWVAPSDDASNEKLVRENLLKNEAANANFVGYWSDTAASAEEAIQSFPALDNMQNDPITVVVLGMGGDGHTASIFPCCAELDAALVSEASLEITQPTTAPHQRVTMTPKRIVNSTKLILHVVGDSKMNVMQEAVSDNDVKRKPITLFLQEPIDIYWAS